MTTAEKKVQPECINDLFGLSPNDVLEAKEKVQTPNGFLVKMTHRYKNLEVWSSAAVVAEDNLGCLADAGSVGLARGIDEMAKELDFEHPPTPEESLAACQNYIAQTDLLPVITNAVVRHRYLYVHNRSSDKPGPLVFADVVQVEGDTEAGNAFNRFFLYDATLKKVINSWDP